MNEIQISAAIEAEEEANQKSELGLGIGAEKKVEASESSKDFDPKIIGIAIVVLFGLFVVGVGGISTFEWMGNTVTGAATIDIDSELNILHAENRAGKLDESEGYIYGDFSFVYYDDLWWTEVVVHYEEEPTIIVIPLHYSPNEVEDIKIDGNLDQEFNKVVDLYISIDPKIVDQHYSLALSELSFNIVKGIGRKPIGSCSEENEACTGRVIISCENNPNNYPVLELVYDESLETGKVEKDGLCMRISGSEEEIVRAADRLLLDWYQVMK
jgi:hypothetical protein